MSKIVDVQPIPIRIPNPHSIERSGLPPGEDDLPGSVYHRKPHRGLVYTRHRETLFIKIITDDGAVGWGETLASVAPQIGAQVVESLIKPQLIGQDPLAGDYLWTQMYHAMRDRGHFTGFYMDALGGCDTALWDLRGRLVGQPVHTLLGGPYRVRLPAYASGVQGVTPAERAESARAWVDQGFRAIKLHLTAGRQDTLATVAAVREAVGPDVRLMVDAHNIYDVAEAMLVGRELEAHDVYFFEAPTDPENVAGLAELCAALRVRIATGESERSRFQFRDRLVARAVDVVQPDLGYVGLSEMRRIAGLAEAFHVPIAPHLSAGLGVCIAATLNLMASIPNCLMVEYSPVSFPLANRFLKEPLRCEAGEMLLPTGPGLGVEIDEAALRVYELPLDRVAA
jgi:L-alanine-DL-glutamate epimerase-like enolase superfamily enzyme